MHFSVLPSGLKEILSKVQANPKFSNFYLAGGTALAIQLGHRQSIDLDFFTQVPFSSNILIDLDYPYEVINQFDNSIEVFIERHKLMFFYFAYPLKFPLISNAGIRYANPIDIGLMKLLALQGRTTRKDIIDLYFIDKKIIPLDELLTLFENHYSKDSFNSYSSFRELLNEDELDSQPMPIMLEDIAWDVMKNETFTKIIKHIQKIIKT